MSSKTERNIKRAIVVLSILLLISVCLLIGVIYYYERVAPTVVPDNTITTGSVNTNVHIMPRKTNLLTTARTPEHAETNGTLWKSTDETILKLYKGQNYDETSFAVYNMFPGDELYKKYLVQVRHKGVVTVHFTANVHPTSDPDGSKLEEVLMCKVEANGDLLYEGLMRDMPAELDQRTPNAQNATTTEIPYKITAYLDGPSVGNAHMNKTLAADFQWWVLVDKEEEPSEPTEPTEPSEPTDPTRPGIGNDDDDDYEPSTKPAAKPSVDRIEDAEKDDETEFGELAVLPKTGDNTIWMLAATLIVGICLFLLLMSRKRKEDSDDQ